MRLTFWIVRALRSLLVAAPDRGHLLESSVFAHRLHNLLVPQPAPAPSECSLALAHHTREREAEVVLRAMEHKTHA